MISIDTRGSASMSRVWAASALTSTTSSNGTGSTANGVIDTEGAWPWFVPNAPIRQRRTSSAAVAAA